MSLRSSWVLALFFILWSTSAATAAESTRVLSVMDWKLNETEQTQQWFASVKERFEAEHPGVVVEYVTAPWGDPYRERIITGVAAGLAPDVVSLSIVWARDLYEQGVLLPLNKLVDQTPELAVTQFIPPTQLYNQKDGVLFGITTAMDSNVLLYDLDVFEESGLDTEPFALHNWSDFVDATRKLTRRDGDQVIRYGLSTPASLEAFTSWLTANGGSLYDIHLSKSQLDAPQARETAGFMVDLIHGYDIVGGDFMAGNASIGFGGTWHPYLIAQERPDMRFNLTSYPVGPSGTQRGTTTWGNMISITRTSENVDLAWEFIRYYAGLQGNIDIFQALGYATSPRLDFYQSPEWNFAMRQHTWMPMIPQIAMVGGVYPFLNYIELVSRVWDPLLVPALNNETPIESAFSEAARIYNMILSE